jgi:hypothetical protein
MVKEDFERAFPIAVRQVLKYKHESHFRLPDRGDLKETEVRSAGVIEVSSVTFLLSKSAYRYV